MGSDSEDARDGRSDPKAPDKTGGGHIQYRELTVETKRGKRNVLVVRPSRRARLDRKRLLALREGGYASRLNDAVDAELQRRTANGDTRYDAILFEAGGGQGPHDGFAPDLTEEEIVEFGELMIGSQLAMFRRVAELGVAVLAGVEFGDRELFAYDRGSRRLAERLEASVAAHATGGEAEGDGEEARLMLWLLDHFAIWSDASVDEFVARRLPDTLAASERIRRKLDRMLSSPN